jgi:NAD(P)-dependent dehydrogenase (short-subunit alcohol dehydrogenase family)
VSEPVVIDLSGRVALVTGAGAGIGQEIASYLARAGAAVAVNDVDGGRAEATAELAKEHGTQAVAVTADVTDDAAVDAMVDSVIARFGSLDIAINNVGMMGGLGARAGREVDGAYARRIIDLNLVATLACCAAEARAMVQGGSGGVIVNVSSGETTRAAPGLSVYAAAKAGINHLTRTLAVELGPSGIRVNAVAPGTTPTEQVRAALAPEVLDAIAASTPLRRHCTPADLAGLVLLLVSDLASAVTGQFVLADMGAHLSLSRPPVAERES